MAGMSEQHANDNDKENDKEDGEVGSAAVPPGNDDGYDDGSDDDDVAGHRLVNGALDPDESTRS
jgi:hypothetical protein